MKLFLNKQFKMLKLCMVLLLIFTACGKSDAKNTSQATTQETTEETTEETTDAETEEPQFKELAEEEKFSDIYMFTLAEGADRNELGNPDACTAEDGSLEMISEIDGGTPYTPGGVIYEHSFFEMKQYGRVIEGDDAPGSGSDETMYKLIPKKEGNTQIAVLDYYIVDEVYQGNVYDITIDSDLKAHINWYSYVEEKDNFDISKKGVE